MLRYVALYSIIWRRDTAAVSVVGSRGQRPGLGGARSEGDQSMKLNVCMLHASYP